MVARGRIQNGVVILEEGAKLPEGASVLVETLDAPVAAPLKLEAFAGCATSFPPDASENHDHYLYGAPRNSDAPPSDLH